MDVLAQISYHPIQNWGPVSPHGVGTAGGFLLGAMLMARRAEPRGIPAAEVSNAVTWGLIGALIGARGFYVLAHLEQFGSWMDVVAVWRGGLTMFGGFAGGLLLGLGYMWRRRISIPLTLDAAAPGFVVGVAVGRIGDLLIADHLGTTTDFFLGYRIPEGAELAPGYNSLPMYAPGQVVHQTALYDLIGVCVLAGVLALVARREPAPGMLFWTFSIWYGLQRVLVDFTRNRELIESSFFGYSGSQWAGAAFALGGLVGLAWSYRAAGAAALETEEPESLEEPEGTEEPYGEEPEAAGMAASVATLGSPESPAPIEADSVEAEPEAVEPEPEAVEAPQAEISPVEQPQSLVVEHGEPAPVEQTPLFPTDQVEPPSGADQEEPSGDERPASDA